MWANRKWYSGLELRVVLALIAATALTLSVVSPAFARWTDIGSALNCDGGGALGQSWTTWGDGLSSDWGYVSGALWRSVDGSWVKAREMSEQESGASGDARVWPTVGGSGYYVETAAHQASFFDSTRNTESQAKTCP